LESGNKKEVITMKTLKYEPTTPETIMKENIVHNDRVIGWIETDAQSIPAKKYHVGLNLAGFHSLIQGWGSTQEEAIANATQKGKTRARILIHEIERLEEILEIKGE
jgi:hypothetical protein